MSRKHSHTVSGKPHADPHHDGAPNVQCKWNGNTRVSGEVNVKFEPGLITQKETEHYDTKTHNDKTRLIGWLTLGAVVIYAGLTWLLAHSAQQSANAATQAANAAVASYESTVRPYLGTAMVATVHGKPENLQFNAIFKNFGTIPSENTTLAWVILLDGKVMAEKKLPDLPVSIFPTDSHQLAGNIGSIDAPGVLHGKKALIVYTADSYRWRGKSQKDCNKFEYAAFAKQFFALGPACFPN